MEIKQEKNNYTYLNSCAKEVLESMDYIKSLAEFCSKFKSDCDFNLIKAESNFKTELEKLFNIATRHLG